MSDEAANSLRAGYLKDSDSHLGRLSSEQRDLLTAGVAEHLDDLARGYREDGYSGGEAMLQALASVGPVPAYARELCAAYRPLAEGAWRRTLLFSLCAGLPLLLFTLFVSQDVLGAGSTSRAVDTAIAHLCTGSAVQHCTEGRAGHRQIVTRVLHVEDLVIGRLAVVQVRDLPSRGSCVRVSVVRPPGTVDWMVGPSTDQPC